MTVATPSDRTRLSLLAALGGSVAELTTPPTGAQTAPPAEAPERIGGARLLRLLGRGGMGEVYLGHHETLDIDVAVKLLSAGASEAEDLIAEARAAARIQHQHVVRLLHAGCENGQAFLVMEHIGGGDAAQQVRRRGYLPWREAALIAAQAASGLAAAHAAGFVHRDVKPANLMLTPEGTVKLADLGLAQRICASGEATSTDAAGTPAYMPAEQWVDATSVGPTADVYALGATLFELLTGEQPFAGPGAGAELLERHRSAPVPDARAIVSGIPRPLAQLVRRMMAKDPAQRPADGAAAERELRAVIAQLGDEQPAPERPRNPRRWRAPTALALVGMLLAAGAIIAAARPTRTWQTPPRAVFLIGDHLPPTVASAVGDGLRLSGLPVIEREAIDRLVGEQDLAAHSRVDTATAIANGRLIGGHVAVFAQVEDGQVALSAVLVETGERVGMAVTPAAQASESAARIAAQAAARLPARGLVAVDGAGAMTLDLGTRHGVHAGDRFRVLSDAGEAVAVATVTTAAADRAAVTVDGTAPGTPARAERIER